MLFELLVVQMLQYKSRHLRTNKLDEFPKDRAKQTHLHDLKDPPSHSHHPNLLMLFGEFLPNLDFLKYDCKLLNYQSLISCIAETIHRFLHLKNVRFFQVP